MNENGRPTKDDQEDISSSRRSTLGLRHYPLDRNHDQDQGYDDLHLDHGPLRSSLGSWNVRDDETFDGSSIINPDEEEEEDFYRGEEDLEEPQTPATSTYKVQLSTRTTASKLDESDHTGPPRRRRPSFLISEDNAGADKSVLLQPPRLNDQSTNFVPSFPVFNIDLKKIQGHAALTPSPANHKSITQYAIDSARSIKTIVIRNAWIVNGLSPFLLLSCLLQLFALLFIFTSISQSQRNIKDMRTSMSYLEVQLSESLKRMEELSTVPSTSSTVNLNNATAHPANRTEDHLLPLDDSPTTPPPPPILITVPLPPRSSSPLWFFHPRWSYKGRRKAPSAFFWVLKLFRYLLIPVLGPISRGVVSVLLDLAWRIFLTFFQIVIVAVLLVVVACRIMCLNRFVDFLKAGCRLL